MAGESTSGHPWNRSVGRIPGIPEETVRFFRLSPGGCFGIRRGELEGRIDVAYYALEVREYLRELRAHYSSLPRLGQVAEVVCGPFGSAIKLKDYRSSGIPLLRISNITDDGTIDESDLVYIDPELADRLGNSTVQPGDLVISQRGTLGSPAVVPSTFSRWSISANLIAIRRPELPADYIQAYLSYGPGRVQLRRAQSGQVQGKITTTDVALVEIPDLANTQDLMAGLSAAKLQRNQMLGEAESLLAGLDAFVFEQLGFTPAPSHDPHKSFGVHLRDVYGKRLDPPAYTPFPTPGNPDRIPIKRLDGIADVDSHSVARPDDENTVIAYVGLPECTLESVREVAIRPYSEVKGRAVARPGDILFARIEPSVFNKKYVFVDSLLGHDYAYISTEFYAVRTRGNEDDQKYLYAMFHSAFVYDQVRGKTTGSSGRRRIDPEMFNSLLIPWPSETKRRKIAAEVTRRRAEARRLRIQAESVWDQAKIDFEAALLQPVNKGKV